MKTIASLTVASLLFSVVGHAAAAPVHVPTWVPRVASPDVIVTIGGQRLALMSMPVRDLGGSKRYAVSFLAHSSFSFVTLQANHSLDPIESPIRIDGFDARVDITDSRDHHMSSDNGQNSFQVTVRALCVVRIKLGKTLVILSGTFAGEQQPATSIGTSRDAVPFAEWDEYVHPTALISACDRWIDYIRITPLN